MDGRVTGVVAALAAGLVIAGCGGERTHAGAATSSDRGALTPVPLEAGSQLTRIAPGAVRHGALPPVGTAQHVSTGGASLSVTLRQVIDPLRGSGARLQPGTRAVGVIVQIRNAGPRLYDSSASGDFSVLPSSGYVTPVLATRGVCRTPQQDFDRYITAGEDRVGCIVFAVADGATINAVRFSPHARAAGRLVWAP